MLMSNTELVIISLYMCINNVMLDAWGPACGGTEG